MGPPNDKPYSKVRGTADRLGKIKRLAKKREGAFKPLRDINKADVRGVVLEWMEIEDWARELQAEGYTEFYARRTREGPRKGELPRGCREFGDGEFGKILQRAFPSGGPDVVGIDPVNKRILVGDVTARESTTAHVRIKPGERHRFPAEQRLEGETVHHLEKTQRDAKHLAERLPKGYADYTVDFQDWYAEGTNKVSKRVRVQRQKSPTVDSSRMNKRTDTDVERGLKSPDRVVDQRPGKPTAQVVPHKPGIGAVSATLKKSVALGTKAWRVSRKIGSIAIKLLLPLSVLDFALEIAFWWLDIFINIDKREKEAKEAALRTVFKQQALIENLIQSEILNKEDVINRFLESWDKNLNHSGFLYARLKSHILYTETIGNVIFSEFTTDNSKQVIRVDISHTEDQHSFELTKASEEVNTENLGTKVTTEKIAILKYTIVPPLITPFDIVLTKINNLFLDTVYFIGIFSDRAEWYLELFHKIGGFNYQITYNEQFGNALEFPQPLNSARCDFCLKYLHGTAKRISQHPIIHDDIKGKSEQPIVGWKRRYWLLSSVLEPKKEITFYKLASKFDGLVNEKAQSPEIQAALTNLSVGAIMIWRDLNRIERNISKPEYYYYGPNYKPAK